MLKILGQLLAMTAAVAVIGSCASAPSEFAPESKSSQYAAVQRPIEAVSPVGGLFDALWPRHPGSYYSCPTNGPIKYVADQYNEVIDVYMGKFSGQSPCGQITSGFGQIPSIYVDPRTHDLYVPNTNSYNILVFHRGQTTPYNVYTDPDPHHQRPSSVAVTSDGTVIAANYQAASGPEMGSFSTWIGGANGGTFVGNFPLTDYGQGGYIAVQKYDTIYYNDFELPGGNLLWHVSCPRGRCGSETQVAGVSFTDAFCMVFDASGDLVVADTQPGRIETFELPNPNPSSHIIGGYPQGLAINEADNHLYTTDNTGSSAVEYTYPALTLVGTVRGSLIVGVALDP